MLLLVDETGVNPLAPGVFATITQLDSAQVIGSGYVQLGGILNVNVRGAVGYVASFQGTLAPQNSQVFFGNAQPNATTTIVVQKYRSPFLSQGGYTNEALRIYVNGWLGDSASGGGDPANALFSAFGAALGSLDLQQQQILAAERLPTCQGAALDSWAYDFFGQFFQRYLDEDDPTFYSRILSAFKGRASISALQQAVTNFYIATANQRLQQLLEKNLAFDTDFGAYDQSGAYDVLIEHTKLQLPVIAVWDGRTNPTLAAQYNIYPPKFVIQIGFTGGLSAWFLDHGALDIDSVLIDGADVQTSTTPPDPRLGALVNFMKAAGRQAIYQTYIAS